MLIIFLFLILLIIIFSVYKLNKNGLIENFSTKKDEEDERQINRQINYCNSLLGQLNINEKINNI